MPGDLGCFDIATTSTKKAFVFNFVNKETGAAATPIPEAKVVIHYATNVISTYAVGTGITLSEGTINYNESDVPSGVNNKLTLEIDGTDFAEYPGMVLKGECAFFVEGDVELVFDLLVEKSSL